jgi:hypothetical protein
MHNTKYTLYAQHKLHTICTTHCQNCGLSITSHIITYSLTMDWHKPKHEAAIGYLTINSCSYRYLPVSFHTILWLSFVLFFFPRACPICQRNVSVSWELFFSGFWFARFLIRITASIQFVRVLYRWSASPLCVIFGLERVIAEIGKALAWKCC